MVKILNWLFCILIIAGTPEASFATPPPHFTLSPAVNEAYVSILDLRFDAAKQQLAILKTQDPNNLLPHYFEYYILFLSCFISEETRFYEELNAKRDNLLEKMSTGDPASPYRLYTQSQVRLLNAIAALKFGDYLKSFQEVSKAYSTLKLNRERFPDFMPNVLSLGALHAAVGNIPDNYKWGVKMISGMEGDVQSGLKEVKQVVEYGQKNPSFAFRQEAIVMYAYLVMLLQNDSNSAWLIVNDPALRVGQSPLAAFSRASVAWRSGRNENVIKIVQQSPKGAGYFPFHFLDYMLGVAKLQRLDTDANVPIERFLTNFKGRFSIKEAWLKLSWHYLLQNKQTQYQNCRQNVLSKGTKINGGDKNALNEVQSGLQPNPTLLKARLLFDGGYHEKAETQLAAVSEADFATPALKMEFLYRLGRIKQMRKQVIPAIENYKRVITFPGSKDTYFACNAALQLGVLYEEAKDKVAARKYFQLCLDIKPPEYAESLHALAKTGLYRVK